MSVDNSSQAQQRLERPAGCFAMLRSMFNTLFALFWTAWCTSWAILKQYVSGDTTVVRRATVDWWARGLVRLWPMHLEVKGKENIPQDEPCVYVCNHQSYADIVALVMTLPMSAGFLAKKELARVPFLSGSMRHSGHVFIDRFSRDRAVEVLREAAVQVKGGKSVIVFPEGTRSADGRLLPFRTGAFRLAKQAGVPLVPIGLSGTQAILPKDAWCVRGGKVRVSIGTALSAQQVESMELRALVAYAREQVAQLSGCSSR